MAYAGLYLGLNDEEGVNWGVIRGGMSSVAQLFVAQLQDYVGLGAEARMNVPGTSQGNWRWRMLPEAITPEVETELSDLTTTYYRVPGTKEPELPK